jgi:hypothetical protein
MSFSKEAMGCPVHWMICKKPSLFSIMAIHFLNSKECSEGSRSNRRYELKNDGSFKGKT